MIDATEIPFEPTDEKSTQTRGSCDLFKKVSVRSTDQPSQYQFVQPTCNPYPHSTNRARNMHSQVENLPPKGVNQRN